MERPTTEGVIMAEIEETKTKGADAKTSKTSAAAIHETQNEHDPKVPEHIEGQSKTPEEISEKIVNPPAPNDDEVKGTDNTPIAAPHSADPQADPKDRTSSNGSEVTGDQPDKKTKALRLERVSGDEVYGTLGAPASTEDSLQSIRKREKKAGRGVSAKGSDVA